MKFFIFVLILTFNAYSSSTTNKKTQIFTSKSSVHFTRKDVTDPCLNFSPDKKTQLVDNEINQAKLKCYRAGYAICEGDAKVNFNQTKLQSCLSTVDLTIEAEVVGKKFDEKLAVIKINELLKEINKTAKDGSEINSGSCEAKACDNKANETDKIKKSCNEVFKSNQQFKEICLNSNVKKVGVLNKCSSLLFLDASKLMVCLDSVNENTEVIKKCDEIASKNLVMFNLCVNSEIKKVSDIDKCFAESNGDLEKFNFCLLSITE